MVRCEHLQAPCEEGLHEGSDSRLDTVLGNGVCVRDCQAVISPSSPSLKNGGTLDLVDTFNTIRIRFNVYLMRTLSNGCGHDETRRAGDEIERLTPGGTRERLEVP